MKQTFIENWQFLTLLLAMFGTWLSLLTILKGDLRELKSDLRIDIADLKGVTQHLVDLHIGHGDRISKLEERTKKL